MCFNNKFIVLWCCYEITETKTSDEYERVLRLEHGTLADFIKKYSNESQ